MTLLQWRKSKKMSRAELAKLLGLSNPTVIYRYETGARVPRPEIMKRIVQLTKGEVSANDFF